MKPTDWCFLLAVLGLLCTLSHSLKCRGEGEEDDDFNEVARMCMRNMSKWDVPSANNRYSTRNNDNNDSNSRNYRNSDSNSGNGCDDNNNNNGGSSRNSRNYNNRNNNNNNEGSYGSRSNNNSGRNNDDNGGSSWSYGGGWQQSSSKGGSSQYGSSQHGGSPDTVYYGSSRYKKSKSSSDRGRNNGNNGNNNGNNNYSLELPGNSPLESVEPCIIQCIFSEMQMLDDAGYPEKSSVKNIMTRKIRNSEVREFIEESIEECYDLLDTENRKERCEYSKTLALCLEEKGRRTCEDWDAPSNKGR